MFFKLGAFFTIGGNFFPNLGQLGANVLVEFENVFLIGGKWVKMFF